MTAKSSQNSAGSASSFDPDICEASVVGCTIYSSVEEPWVPMHQHRRGQLLMTWDGVVGCELKDSVWPVAPDCAFWIPGSCLHRSFVSTQGKFCLVFLDEQSKVLPDICCFLRLTPLVREMVWHMASVGPHYGRTSSDGKIATALLGQLACMEVEHFSVSIPNNPRLRRIAECLFKDPASRRTVGEWADIVAISEKTLGRLVHRETGMSFVHWRQQLQLVVAIQMLKRGATVPQVANALGYESTNAFGTMFKNKIGKAPGKCDVFHKKASSRQDRD
jgi:AraC-like DNA-binding protein